MWKRRQCVARSAGLFIRNDSAVQSYTTNCTASYHSKAIPFALRTTPYYTKRDFHSSLNVAADVSFLTNPRDRFNITREDVLDLPQYEKVRPDVLNLRKELKSLRRIEIGPHAIITFQNYQLLWTQIHEMLRIEKGGEEQIPDELAAYAPLIPKGNELIFTLMFEIEDKGLRNKMLYQLGHVEDTVTLTIDNHVIKAVATSDGIDRTTPDGKTSAVHFLKFSLNAEQRSALLSTTKPVTISVEHPSYPHMTRLGQQLLTQLRAEV